jgi:hypothetical protein
VPIGIVLQSGLKLFPDNEKGAYCEMRAWRKRSVLRTAGLWLCLTLAGCAAATQITNSARSGIEQKLLVQALERSFNRIDPSLFRQRTVLVEFYGLTPDKDFARELFIAWLHRNGARTTALGREAELRLKVFASVLAVDRGHSFFGTPAFTVPLMGFAVPEIPVFRNVSHVGHAEVKISTTDGDSGDFIAESPGAVGKAHHNDYTLFIVIHFTRKDLDRPVWDFGAINGQ